MAKQPAEDIVDNGITWHRSCTDILCTLIFLAF